MIAEKYPFESLYGEILVKQNFYAAKSLYGEFSYSEIFLLWNFLQVKFYSGKTSSPRNFPRQNYGEVSGHAFDQSWEHDCCFKLNV